MSINNSNIGDVLYFDYNASACVVDDVRKLCASVSHLAGNPSAVHSAGRAARSTVEKSKLSILQEDSSGVSDSNYDVIFTSGATEANNMIVSSFDGDVLVSAIEHVSVLQARPDATIASVNQHGVVNVDDVEQWLRERNGKPALVSVMYANNETGVYQPVDEISRLCKTYGAKYHCDAVQVFSKELINFSLFDTISVSAHKFGGLSGVGCLVYKKDFPLKPLLMGGGQQQRMRPGTENVLGIASFAAGLSHARAIRSQGKWDLLQKQRDYLENEITKICADVMVFGRDAKRLVNTSLIEMPGVISAKQVMMFDLANVCVSAGSACSSGVIKESHVLKAMHAEEKRAKCALRISLPPYTTQEQVEKFVDVWKNMFQSAQRCATSV